MKKTLKIICLVLLLGGLIALGVCYYTMPIRTKEAFDIVVKYLNTPLGIIGGTTITLGLVVVVVLKLVLSSHKLGIKKEFEELKKKSEKDVIVAKEYYENALAEKEATKQLVKSQETRIDKLESGLVKVCSTIPNVKVNKLGEQIDKEHSELKNELNATLSSIDTDIVSYVEEKAEKQAVNDRISELEEKIGKLVEQYGKERTDD